MEDQLLGLQRFGVEAYLLNASSSTSDVSKVHTGKGHVTFSQQEAVQRHFRCKFSKKFPVYLTNNMIGSKNFPVYCMSFIVQ